MNSNKDHRALLKSQSISVVFPAYNEAENIEAAVIQARQSLQEWFGDVEIIIVDDGSADATGATIDRLSREHADVVAVHHEVNRGYGAALCSGFSRAEKDYVFFSDSDLQFDLKEISRLLEHIETNDIVVGYRARRADPLHRRVNAWCWNMLVRMVLGIKVRDIDCAFKLFKRRVFNSINLTAVGAMVNTEILALAGAHKFRIKEVPVSHYPRVKGSQTGANLGVILKAFVELFRMYGRLKKGNHAVVEAAQVELSGKES